MKTNGKNANRLAILWHKLLQNPNNSICTDKLKSASILDVNILRILKEEKAVIIGDIGKVLSVTPSTLSSAIKRLEKSGLIKRVMCKADLRSYSLQLTDEGKKEIDEHCSKELLIMAKMLSVLESEEEQETLLGLLEKMLYG